MGVPEEPAGQEAGRGSRRAEWIAVAIIVAVVLVVAMPLRAWFTQSRGKAIRLSCLANMKSHGGAWAMYATDFGNRLPLYDNGSAPGFVTAPTGQSAQGNHALISDLHPSDTQAGAALYYIRNVNVLVCPGDPARERKLSYTLNGLFLGKRQDLIIAPATKVMEVDQCSVSDYVFLKYTAGQYLMDEFARPGNFAHFRGLNCLFADGHVKWYAREWWPLGGPVTPANKDSAMFVGNKPR
jgi:prepilin-type processing-associated H-X9-DG protein